MFKPILSRTAVRALSGAAHAPRSALRSCSEGISATTISTVRQLSTTPVFRKDKSEEELEGKFARTDKNVHLEYSEEVDRGFPVQGRSGIHFKRTLASFSLEERVSVVTGGARGLGLVMGQGLVNSGSNLAIVDLNREC